MSKALWRLLLIAVATVALYQVVFTGKSLLSYLRLDARVPALEVEWGEISLGRSRFALVSKYTYRVKGKQYFGKTQWGKPYHLNEISVKSEIQRREGENWKVWINRDNPRISSMEKALPLKDLFYSLCAFGIFGYFIFLRLHLLMISKRM